MARFDWDRLRRIRPLDGADVRVDPDGAHVWERPEDGASTPFGSRRLRHGVVIRRRRPEATNQPALEPEAATTLQRGPRTIRCPQCGAEISRRKRLRHSRRCPGPKV